MKHQQITVDFASMVFTACSYLALAGAVWILLRLIQACFWLPRHLKKQSDIQRMLQDKVESYEKFILECEEKEKVDLDGIEDVKKDPVQAEKWKERRECLEMLKKELSRVRDNKTDDSHEWDYLLEEDEAKDEGASITELEGDEIFKEKCGSEVNAREQEVSSEDKKEQ